MSPRLKDVQVIHKNLLRYFRWASDYKDMEGGRMDKWERPRQQSDGTLIGDCEDFALECYFRCREVGIEEKNVTLSVCQTFMGKASGVQADHAVLLYKEDDQYYVLDNRQWRIYMIQDSDYLHFYVPVGRLNGEWKELKISTDE